ncbi:MAG: hypothetical protein HY007_04105 [Candidatus Sungbacteria bacterium]|nr:hypothetical protein [Candidatus Sungbacteria bacterium]
MEPMKSGMCGCMCHKMLSLLVAVFGLVFLLGNLSILTQGAVMVIWPVLVIAAGLTKMMKSKCTCCSHGAGMCMNCAKDGGMNK